MIIDVTRLYLYDEIIIYNSPTKLEVPGNPQFAKQKKTKSQLNFGTTLIIPFTLKMFFDLNLLIDSTIYFE